MLPTLHNRQFVIHVRSISAPASCIVPDVKCLSIMTNQWLSTWTIECNYVPYHLNWAVNKQGDKQLNQGRPRRKEIGSLKCSHWFYLHKCFCVLWVYSIKRSEDNNSHGSFCFIVKKKRSFCRALNSQYIMISNCLASRLKGSIYLGNNYSTKLMTLKAVDTIGNYSK